MMEDDNSNLESTDNNSNNSNNSNSSFTSTSSSNETPPPVKRYKLPLSSNYKSTDVSRQTQLRWEKKSQKYLESHCISKATTSSGASVNVNKSPEKINFITKISSNDSVNNYQNEPSFHEENRVSGENENTNNNDCTSNKIASDGEYFPCSVSHECVDKVVKGNGSLNDYYPSQCKFHKENLEEEEEDLCSLSDDSSGISESESEIESLDKEVPLSDKNKNLFNQIMFAESQLTVRDVIILTTAFSLDAKLDDGAKVKLSEFTKVLAGKQFRNINLSKYTMNQCFSSQAQNMTYHYYCSHCTKQILYSVEADKPKRYKEASCDDCKKKQQITNASSNYFLSMNLKYEIELLLSNSELKNDIMNNLRKRDVKNNIYEDVYSGSIHKKIMRNSCNNSEYLLTLNASTDGAPLTKSGKTGFWPLQVILNDLSLKLRFKNVLVCGLFLTSTEPKGELLNLYLKQVYVNQMQKLFQEGIDIKYNNEMIKFKFVTHAFIVDAVARAIVQNRIQFNGYYGCSWCYQLGKYFKSVHGVRYPVDQDTGGERTHASHLNDVRMAKDGSICNEVKGPCALQDEPYIDMVWSFPYEELHAMLLGSTLTILNEWKNGESEFKLSKAQIDFIEKRFLNITPTDEIHRLPRSGILKGTAKPKGAELKHWLVHYSLPCLCNVLNTDALDHFSLFVKASYTLLKASVSDEELDQCAIDLMSFVVNYAKHYENDKITYNIHIMLHIIASIRKTGPIFCNSAFPFEGNIYTLKTYVSGPRCMDRQIARKHLQTLIFKTDNTRKLTKSEEVIRFCSNLFHPTRFTKSFNHGEDIVYCGKNEIKNISGIGNCATYKKCIYNNTVYHSEAYKQTKKTNNSIVQMHSGEYGRIVQIVNWNYKPYLELRFFHMFPENPFKNVTHIKKIESEYRFVTLRSIRDVKCKVMLINARNARYVSHLPNNIEIQ